MLAPSILASVTNSRRFDILDPSLNAIEQLPFAAHCALLGCPPCLRPPVHHVSGTYSPRRLARRRPAPAPCDAKEDATESAFVWRRDAAKPDEMRRPTSRAVAECALQR